ncbi:glycosyltransferase [Phyllobacterium sp. YR531]|uniref:glycosyltransferase n=1 Tax=Phyllobacterium sp. YR531 TaxID=1144343 RepID=UPI00026FAA1A|nr:glycosyltransferase [Phyllobacterium sp. YR531]EJN02278.1 glycosyl transferase [Phyllobacterium sp. YR531]
MYEQTTELSVSIVIPCFNARGKIDRCLGSLRRIEFPQDAYEVIFVDDCSTDGTYELLIAECSTQSNWSVVRLETNSGSPSRPRNFGTKQASGRYIIYLDCDDEILPDTLSVHYEHAQATNASLVRGYLIAEDGRTRREMNKISSWTKNLSKVDRIQRMLVDQSTTTVSLIRKSLLETHQIEWPEDIRMSEDTLFLIEILCAADIIEYVDHATFIYHKKASNVPSSTQLYGARELKDHLFVWQEVELKLRQLSLSYYKLRLHISLKAAINALIFHNRGDVDKSIFERFSDFINLVWATVRPFIHSNRTTEILQAALKRDFDAFNKLCRPRMVVAGQDLKFITPAINSLSKHFDIRIDEWEGHDHHNRGKSWELLEWAEFIWCEWLLGNAVWYSENKRPDQKLVIRMHRMELTRDFGSMLQIENVNAIISVSVLFFERLLERFPSIPRSKARLIPNYSNLGPEDENPTEERLFKLAMIGIVPARKGFKNALEILKQLREKDSRYELDVYGHGPETFTWITRDPVEMAYYEDCQTFIKKHNLSDAVLFRGRCDLPRELKERKIGFVLSVSDSHNLFPGFESFHLAVLDGYAGGGQSVVLRWDGCEYIYPDNMIFDSKAEIVEYISHMTLDRFYAGSAIGRKMIEDQYTETHFVSAVKKLFSEWT